MSTEQLKIIDELPEILDTFTIDEDKHVALTGNLNLNVYLLYIVQKQPSRGVFLKNCSENMKQIYRRTPMRKCDFNKVAL